jgi:DNA-binding LacI/PurR family transcriptional regulator
MTMLAKPRRVTIRNVAEAAGVSTATVSLALAGNPLIAEATRARVRSIAASLGYRPSALGRGLQGGRSEAVGLVIPHTGGHVFGHLYFMDLLSGVSEVLEAANKVLVLSTTSSESDEEAAYLKILQTQHVGGIILASAALHDANIERLKASGHPFVFIGRYPFDPSIPNVSVDDAGGAAAATRHLLALGHRRIAHISGPLSHLSAIDRKAGYEAALAEAGAAPTGSLLFEGDYSEAAGQVGMAQLLALAEPPTALFAGSDETAIGAMAVLREAGREPGRDFPVVGFDDVILARHVSPGLTTIRQPMRQMGRSAAEVLIRVMNGEPFDDISREFTTELVIRQSCGVRFLPRAAEGDHPKDGGGGASAPS